MARNARVLVNSGPVDATDPLRLVPKEKWPDLMLARRHFAEVKLSYDCRCLVQFCDDAREMYGELGFASADAMISEGYGLRSEEVDLALEWLRLNPPDEPLPFETAIIAERARRNREIDEKTQENRRPHGTNQHSEDLYHEKVDDTSPPTGTSSARALRVLRDSHPEIHARVLTGELTPNAGMVAAGRRKPQIRPPASPFKALAKKIREKGHLLTPAERNQLRELLL